MKPLSLLLLLTSAVLGGMIVLNAFKHPQSKAHVVASAPLPPGATTHVEVTPPADWGATVVIKYDPLVEDVQRELLASGVYRGLVDGVNGERTRQAIAQYQKANNLPVTGEPSADLVNHIRYTRQVEAASRFTGSVEPAPNVATATKPVSDQALTMKKIQVALAGLGYEINAIDGKLNEETKGAILKFEMDNGLDMNSAVDQSLLAALKIADN